MRSPRLFMNNLYFPGLIEDDDDKVIATIRINEDHDIFKGHFPGNPVLPGVCIIQIVKELMEEVCNKELQLIEAGNIKYLAFINPLMNKILNFEIHYACSESGRISCSTRVYYENTDFCRLKGVLMPR